MFPSWAATFSPAPYQKVIDKFAPGKTYSEVMAGAAKVRDLGHRDLWLVEDRVVKSN